MTPVAVAPGRWQLVVPVDWPGFAGHFPGDPILPAAELIDHAALLLATGQAELVQARFLHPVRPGDVLEFRQDDATRLRLRIWRGSLEIADLRWRA